MTDQQPDDGRHLDNGDRFDEAPAHDDRDDELVRALSDEVRLLRERLEMAPARLTQAQTELADQRRRTANLAASNDKLSMTLRQAREQLVALREEMDRMAQPPVTYGTLVEAYDGTADVLVSGRKMRVTIGPELPPAVLRPGVQVLLNEAMVVVDTAGYEAIGEVVTLADVLPEGDLALVFGQADTERVVRLSEAVRELPLRVGDSLLIDSRAGMVLAQVPKAEVEAVVLEEVPDVDYADIGGLSSQLEAVRDAVELPFLHAETFAEHHLAPPKGILLYGPPGCGKTLIAKAVANSLAKKVGERTGRAGRSHFLNIKGPELLNKYVGETERHLRLVFSRAREKAADGMPVIVFFDEMDALFRTRGSGVSSDVETTVVPQLLSEIDGVEKLSNVLVIGASNREDMIDPAILRPGRLDVKIKIERPDAEAAAQIFSIYLNDQLPLHPADLAEHGGDVSACLRAMVDTVVGGMYAEVKRNEFLEVTYAGGDKEVLYFKDFNSGAMIENIVSRAKKSAIKDFLATGVKGISLPHLTQACRDEFTENEDLPNTTNPDDWARIAGKKGERIVFVRTLTAGKQGSEPGRSIDTVSGGGQYL
jgi:proteasome-associated ATPase